MEQWQACRSLRKIADEHDLKMITIKDLIRYRHRKEKLVKREVEIKLPTDFGDFRAIGFSDVIDGKENVALVKGEIIQRRTDACACSF